MVSPFKRPEMAAIAVDSVYHTCLIAYRNYDPDECLVVKGPFNCSEAIGQRLEMRGKLRNPIGPRELDRDDSVQTGSGEGSIRVEGSSGSSLR